MALESNGEMEPKSKYAEETGPYSSAASEDMGTVTEKWQDTLAEIKYAFTTKDGWIGDYVCRFCTLSLTFSN
jgi:hypothetical protein